MTTIYDYNTNIVFNEVYNLPLKETWRKAEIIKSIKSVIRKYKFEDKILKVHILEYGLKYWYKPTSNNNSMYWV